MKIFVPIFLVFSVAAPLLAQEPSPSATPSPAPTAVPAAAEFKPVDGTEKAIPRPPLPTAVALYNLDYDDARDLFLEPGTQKGFTGPVVWKTEDSGELELTGFLKDGRRDGFWQEYHPGGRRVAFEGSYEDGVPTGAWRYWFETGQLDTAGQFTNGEPSGVWASFYENGKPEAIGAYERGKRTGKWTVYEEATGKEHVVDAAALPAGPQQP